MPPHAWIDSPPANANCKLPALIARTITGGGLGSEGVQSSPVPAGAAAKGRSVEQENGAPEESAVQVHYPRGQRVRACVRRCLSDVDSSMA